MQTQGKNLKNHMYCSTGKDFCRFLDSDWHFKLISDILIGNYLSVSDVGKMDIWKKSHMKKECIDEWKKVRN